MSSVTVLQPQAMVLELETQRLGLKRKQDRAVSDAATDTTLVPLPSRRRRLLSEGILDELERGERASAGWHHQRGSRQLSKPVQAHLQPSSDCRPCPSATHVPALPSCMFDKHNIRVPSSPSDKQGRFDLRRAAVLRAMHKPEAATATLLHCKQPQRSHASGPSRLGAAAVEAPCTPHTRLAPFDMPSLLRCNTAQHVRSRQSLDCPSDADSEMSDGQLVYRDDLMFNMSDDEAPSVYLVTARSRFRSGRQLHSSHALVAV